MEPDFLGELAAIDSVVAVKQANDDQLGPIEGLAVLAGNDDTFLATLEFGGAGGILVASHMVGGQMREMWDAAQDGDLERAREIDAGLRPLYEGLAVTTNPIPIKVALEMTGLIPWEACGCRWFAPTRSSGRRWKRRWRASAFKQPSSSRPDDWWISKWRVRSFGCSPSGARGDRQEHDRLRERRADRRGRHRADVPDRRDARHRPRPARLLLPARPRRGHRGDRPHPRPRGPRRRAALRAARDRRAAGDLRRRG